MQSTFDSQDEVFKSRYYTDIEILKTNYNDTRVLEFINAIIEDCEDQHIKSWYETWDKKSDLWYVLMAYKDGRPISISGARIDGKVICYSYTLRALRNAYRGLVQIDFLPLQVSRAITSTVYMTVHPFSQRFEKLAKAAGDRVITNGLPSDMQPYRGKFEFKGIKPYRNVDQYFYELDLKKFDKLTVHEKKQ